MTDESTSPALRVALAYYQAWTSGDISTVMDCLAPDVVVDTPGGQLSGADAFRGFIEPFTRMVKGATLIAAFGDQDSALIMYDTATMPVPSAPGAEYLKVADGRIVYDRFVFDRLPFEQARQR